MSATSATDLGGVERSRLNMTELSGKVTELGEVERSRLNMTELLQLGKVMEAGVCKVKVEHKN